MKKSDLSYLNHKITKNKYNIMILLNYQTTKFPKSIVPPIFQ